MFRGCESLRSITVPDSVTYFRYYALADCPNLRKVEFGENSKLKFMLESAIQGCSSLESITLPKSLKWSDEKIFSGCSNLKTLEIYSPFIVDRTLFISNASLEIIYHSDAPAFYKECFRGLNLKIYYPAGNTTWEKHIANNYGGDVVWIPY